MASHTESEGKLKSPPTKESTKLENLSKKQLLKLLKNLSLEESDKEEEEEETRPESRIPPVKKVMTKRPPTVYAESGVSEREWYELRKEELRIQEKGFDVHSKEIEVERIKLKQHAKQKYWERRDDTSKKATEEVDTHDKIQSIWVTELGKVVGETIGEYNGGTGGRVAGRSTGESIAKCFVHLKSSYTRDRRIQEKTEREMTEYSADPENSGNA